jgi:hypothetical protein
VSPHFGRGNIAVCVRNQWSMIVGYWSLVAWVAYTQRSGVWPRSELNVRQLNAATVQNENVD